MLPLLGCCSQSLGEVSLYWCWRHLLLSLYCPLEDFVLLWRSHTPTQVRSPTGCPLQDRTAQRAVFTRAFPIKNKLGQQEPCGSLCNLSFWEGARHMQELLVVCRHLIWDYVLFGGSGYLSAGKSTSISVCCFPET